MSESDLHKLSIDALLDLLMKNTKELIEFNCEKNEIEYEARKNELQLIQRFIVSKRAEYSPG